MKRSTRLVAATLAGALSLAASATTASAEGAGTTSSPATEASTAPPTAPPTTAHVAASTAPSTPTTVHHEQPTTPPPPPGTTTAPHESAPPTTKATAPSGLERLVALVDTFVAQVEGSNIEPGLKGRLLGRLREVRAKALTGKADTAAMQALINDIHAALNLPNGGGPSTTVTASSEPHGGRPAPPTAKSSLDVAGQVHLLDLAEAKVNASNLSDADKQVLLDAIGALRVQLASGPLTGEVLGQTLGHIREALEKNHPGSDVSGAAKTGSPHDRAADALAREIERIKHSDLPDDVKAKIVASLTSAQDHLGDAAEAAKDIKDKLVEQQMKRIEEIRTKLGAAIDHELARADEVAAIAGSDAAKLADARAKLTDAKDKLAMATTAGDLKAVWLTLRAAHLEIRAARPNASQATTLPPTTIPSTTEVPTTAS